MMKTGHKFRLALPILTAAMYIAFSAFSSVSSRMTVADAVEYELYPKVHRIDYGSGTVDLPDSARVHFGGGIDAATIEHVYDTLALADMLCYTDGDRAFDVYIGVAGSGDEADAFIGTNDIGFEIGLFDKNDAYLLDIGSDHIAIVGRDTDAAFYGITTLAAIIEQAGKTVRKLKVQDYSDSVFRGFIEGYYGIPWTTDERVELMEFGSKFKTNIYIYAPKDDAYHSSNWRGLYSPADLAELGEQIEAGRRTKTRFAWALHPFLHDKFTNENYVEDLNVVLAKFEQLYAAGVRQFVISADDVDTSSGKPDAAMHRDLLNDVCDWLKEKGDCYDLIFVPSAYCYKSSERLGVELASYYKALTAHLDPSVYVMWTGLDVCSTVQSGMFDEFTELTGRKAFMWLNWPVNDYAQSYLLMGKGEVLDKTLKAGEEPDFFGIVTNPMQYAEASKLSIFAVADYCWNMAGFDVDKSYIASFEYVESEAYVALRALCNHLANATLYEGKYFEESVDIVQYINSFNDSYRAGSGVKQAASVLKAKFEEVISNAEIYAKTACNKKLKSEISPWIESLSLLAEQCATYLDALIGMDDMTASEVENIIKKAQSFDGLRETCVSPMLDIVTHNCEGRKVDVAPAVLSPFAKTLAGIVKDEASIKLGISIGNTYSGFDGIYQGSLDNITDGDDSTFLWLNGYPADGAFVRIDLGEAISVNNIKVLNGKPDGGDCLVGYVEYSVDGKNYTRVGELDGVQNLYDLSDSPVNARFIRLVCTSSEYWVAIREVSVNV